MTAIDSTIAGRRDLRVISLIGTAHFFSHFYILVLPPLFLLLRDVYGVSYTALGLALAVLNAVTGLTQAPVGFLVDRFGPRALLVAGLALFSLATGLIGLFPSYPMLLALMVLAASATACFIRPTTPSCRARSTSGAWAAHSRFTPSAAMRASPCA